MDKMDYESICRQVCDVAREAGAYIAGQRRLFSYDKVEFKGAHNLVSYVDKETEKLLVRRLGAIVPEAGFVTEEGTVECRMDREWRWIVDPLDGTTNFAHGLAPYCVSIALMRGEELVVGVVYEITHDEMFYAWQGSAAYLNGEVIRVSDINTIDKALVAIGFSYSSEELMGDSLRQVDYFQRHSDGVRRTGSAAANIIYVACGRMDVFAQPNLSAWDVAGGALIAQRAGAAVSDFAGGTDYVFGRQIVVASPRVYDEFLSVVRR